MKAAPADQLRLLDLQVVDTRASQLRHRRKSLPEHAEFAQLNTERETLMEDFTEAETRVSDLDRAQRKAEADLEPVRERRVRNQQKIDSGAIGDAKALSAMIEEVEHLGRRISDLEDAELEVMEELEQAREKFDKISARRGELDQRISEVVARRDEQVAALDTEIADAVSDREAVVATVPAPLVALYDKIAVNHGTGAAKLEGGRCGGCRLEVNPADLRALRAAPADEVCRCEECGRILVRA